MASVSYDSVALLRDFATRKGLKYPMLSDPDSKVIRAFGILNENFPKGHAWYGVPFPGTYIIDEHGIVRAKFFEEDHRERYTAGAILVHQLNDAEGLKSTKIETPHLTLTYSASDTALAPGGRTALLLDIQLKPGMHVYAPGVEGYIPIDWRMPESKAWLAHPVSYPPSRKLHLAAIRETVPVYEGYLTILRDLTVAQNRELAPALTATRDLVVEGSFRYQACDDRECYPPQTVPLKWSLHIEPVDSKRAPVELQRKGKQRTK